MRALAVTFTILSFACEPEPLNSVGSPSARDLGDIVDPADDSPASECGYVRAPFSYNGDPLDCGDQQFVRFDERYGMAVGVLTCGVNDEVRVFLSTNAGEAFSPAADFSGVGEDHCELVNPTLTRDLIQPAMVVGSTTTFQGTTVWHRGEFGEPFARVEGSEFGDYASILNCGIDVSTCETTVDYQPPFVDQPPPSDRVPCSIGGTSRMTYVIPALEMERGAGDSTGAGACVADVVFFDPPEAHSVFRFTDANSYDYEITDATINGWSNGCSDYHCGTLIHGDGSIDSAPCDVLAFCDVDTNLAMAVDFTW